MKELKYNKKSMKFQKKSIKIQNNFQVLKIQTEELEKRKLNSKVQFLIKE